MQKTANRPTKKNEAITLEWLDHEMRQPVAKVAKPVAKVAKPVAKVAKPVAAAYAPKIADPVAVRIDRYRFNTGRAWVFHPDYEELDGNTEAELRDDLTATMDSLIFGKATRAKRQKITMILAILHGRGLLTEAQFPALTIG